MALVRNAVVMLAWATAVVALCHLGYALASGDPDGGRLVVTQDNHPEATRIDRHHRPSAVIFPMQELPVRFFHDKHLKAGADCVTCHESVATSVRAGDVNLPKAEVCAVCHSVEAKDPAHADPRADCQSCHVAYQGSYAGTDPHEHPDKVDQKPLPWVFPPPNLKFNHKVHLDRGVECKTCHGDLGQIGLATVDNALPTMGTCLGCHDGKTASAECTTCHMGLPDGRVMTQYKEGALAPHGFYRSDAHDDAWLAHHADTARADSAGADGGYCANCHAPNECTDCHNGVVKPNKIHPANWILVHPTSARADSLNCQSCHREQSFCVSCHDRVGIFDRGENRDTTIAFHPNGWVNLPGSAPASSHHKFEAQRNIGVCASCHQEQTCLSCHSNRAEIGFGASRVFGPINPHPADFADRCGTMQKLNPVLCNKCHSSSDPALLRCK